MAGPSRSVSVAGVVLDNQDRALLIRRRDNGRWEPPGGVLELGERIHDGLRRELAEETGLEVEPGLATGIYNNVPGGIVAIVFRCRAVGGELRSNDEVTAFRWASAEEVSALMTPAYAVRVLDALRGDGPHVRDHDGVELQ